VCVLIEKLGQSGIKMLLFLLKKGESNKNSIRINAEMGVEGVLKAINELGKRGLITDREGKGTETLYSLTSKGKEIAELLKKADDLLEGA
jgi:predicted transcriptional regulator